MSKKVRSYRKIDEHSYNAIKKLIGTGLTGREIQKAMGISQSTFWRIKKSETIDEYRNVVNEKNTPAPKKTEQITKQKVVYEYPDIELKTDVSPKLHIIIELLQHIDKKLEALSGEEPQQPKKRGFFH